MNHLLNHMRLQASLAGGDKVFAKIGIVRSYDPTHYAATVEMDENVVSGWLPVTSMAVGNGWGVLTPPSPGDQVEVVFTDGNFQNGYIVGRFFNDEDRAPSAEAGVLYLIHQSGSLLKFENDGTVNLVAAEKLVATAKEFDLTGDMKLTGNMTMTGNFSAGGEVNDKTGTMSDMRKTYNGHTHPAPNGTTKAPTQGM